MVSGYGILIVCCIFTVDTSSSMTFCTRQSKLAAKATWRRSNSANQLAASTEAISKLAAIFKLLSAFN
jgi:hypothetical protein